jgi:hypothetical protein
MNNTVAVKETICTHCNHRVVCVYKDDYLSILKAVSEVTISYPCSDGLKTNLKRIADFDFIGEISIPCRHYQKIDSGLWRGEKN